MTWLISAGAAVAGALLAWLVLRSQSAALEQRLARAEQDTVALQAETAAERNRSNEFREAKAKLQAELEAERKNSAEKLALVSGAREELQHAFQSLSAQALDENSARFLQLANENLQKFQVQAQGDLEQRKQAVEALVAPIATGLSKVDEQIRQIENERKQAYGSLSEQVKSLITTQEKLQQETGNLVKALRAPQVRGRWGEIQLRRVVELAGMLPYCDFAEQVSLNTETGKLRPDLVVKLPGGKTVVVDAKAPLQAYLDALESRDDEQRQKLLADHAGQIRAHMAALGSKAYWEQLASTPDFVVMFLPGETFFSAALAQDSGLIEYGVNQRVIPASPTTLIALLQAVAYGWRQEKIAASAQEISAHGKDLYDRLCKLAEYVQEVGKHIGGAVKSYNDMVGSLEGRVLVTARKFPELGISMKTELKPLKQVDRTPRALEAPELVTQIELASFDLAAEAEEPH